MTASPYKKGRRHATKRLNLGAMSAPEVNGASRLFSQAGDAPERAK